jgi:hypothetical protein
MPAINARILGAKDIEQALINAFEEWTKEDINGKFWDAQFKDREMEAYDAVTLERIARRGTAS